jgi:hypothetical protein
MASLFVLEIGLDCDPVVGEQFINKDIATNKYKHLMALAQLIFIISIDLFF